MLVFGEKGKPEYLENNLAEQSRELANSTHIWCWVWKSNLGYNGGRWALSPLRHPYSPKVCHTLCFHIIRKSNLTDSINYITFSLFVIKYCKTRPANNCSQLKTATWRTAATNILVNWQVTPWNTVRDYCNVKVLTTYPMYKCLIQQLFAVLQGWRKDSLKMRLTFWPEKQSSIYHHVIVFHKDGRLKECKQCNAKLRDLFFFCHGEIDLFESLIRMEKTQAENRALVIWYNWLFFAELFCKVTVIR